MAASDSACVLVVDDLGDHEPIVAGLCAQLGVTVVTACSGRDALAQVTSRDVALAILGAGVPDMDVVDLAARIHALPNAHDVPVLIEPIDLRVLEFEVAAFVGLHEHRRRLAETLRLQETFVAAINHDLRGPLGTITLGLQLLADQVAAPGRDVLGRLTSAVERMVQMLDQLYDVARTRLGEGLRLEPARGDLRPIVETVVAEAGLRAIRIALDVVGDTSGTWDLTRVGRIATNLIGNAVRYGDRDAGVRVLLDGRAADEVRLVVHNAGAIPADVLPRIFEPFRRGTQRTTDGLGLGLYIVREIARAHGGDVAVTSTTGDGTRFEVWLPRSPRGATAVTAN